MPDSLHALIRDTLTYLKDPLAPKQALFASAEECAMFQKKPQPRQTIATKPVQTTPVRPIVKESPIAVAAVPKEIPPPLVIAAAPKESAPAPKENPSPPDTDRMSQLKKSLNRIAPGIKLVDVVPDDAEAKKIAGAYRDKIADAEVVLLACQTDADTLEFLKSLAKAIEQHLSKCRIIPADKLEVEKRWDVFLQKNSFKLIIASDGLQKLPELMRFYKSPPASSMFLLDKTPVIALSPAALYKSLEHKALLWKTLCQMLKK